MTIHIPIKGAFKKERTGVENYIRKLLEQWCKKDFKGLDFILYYRGRLEGDSLFKKLKEKEGFELKKIHLPYFWTQVGLSWELLKNYFDTDNTGNDILFVPAHVLPIYCGMKAVATIHGLEFEHYPQYYPLWHRLYLKWMTRLACLRAQRIIAVSKATKNDLLRFYDVPEEMIEIIHHGAETQINTDERASKTKPLSIVTDRKQNKSDLLTEDYILCLGRVELKKNLLNIISAFETLKEAENFGEKSQNIKEKKKGNLEKNSVKFNDLKLVLAGGKGYGYGEIQLKIKNSKLRGDIVELGYVSEEEKWRLLREAKAFCFATFYEGFGIPILEAQKVQTPVLVSKEGAGAEVVLPRKEETDFKLREALLVNPHEPDEIARKLFSLLTNTSLRERAIEAGNQNLTRFDWKETARRTLKEIQSSKA